MGFMMRHATQRTFFYPLTTAGKFATRVSGEGNGVARVNKRGETVTEDFADGIAGRIVGFRVVPETADGLPAQYHVILRDPDDESSEAVLSFGAETSLGRQLINALLALTPEDLHGIVSFYLRSVEEEGRKNIYLSVYRGKHDVREMRVKPALEAEAIPRPGEKYAEDGRTIPDFSEVNAFFRVRAEAMQDRWREILTQPAGAGVARSGGAMSGGAAGRDETGKSHLTPLPEPHDEDVYGAYEHGSGVIPF